MTADLLVRPMTFTDIPSLRTIKNSIWTTANSPVLHHYDSIEAY